MNSWINGGFYLSHKFKCNHTEGFHTINSHWHSVSNSDYGQHHKVIYQQLLLNANLWVPQDREGDEIQESLPAVKTPSSQDSCCIPPCWGRSCSSNLQPTLSLPGPRAYFRLITLSEMNETLRYFRVTHDTHATAQVHHHGHMQHQKQQLQLAQPSWGFFLGALPCGTQASRGRAQSIFPKSEFLFQTQR